MTDKDTRTPPVSPLEEHTGFWLRFVSNHVSGRFREHVEAMGISLSEWVALRTVFAEAGISPGRLTTMLGMTKGACSKVLDRLEKAGLACRTPDPSDGRGQQIVLTDKGRSLVPQLASLADENDRQAFGVLTPREEQELKRILQKLVSLHGLSVLPVS